MKKYKTPKTRKLHKNTKTKTYLIKSECLSKKHIKSFFKKRKKWKEYNIKTSKKKGNKHQIIHDIDFLHVDAKYTFDKSLYNVKSTIKNMVDLSSDNFSVTYKSNLFSNLNKLNNPKINLFLPKQIPINIYNIFKTKTSLKKYKHHFSKNKVFIFKYVYSRSGKDIFIFKDYNSFEKNVLELINKSNKLFINLDYIEYKKLGNTKKTKYNIEWVLQEYITNPALFEGKKYHFRSYLLFNNTNKKGYYFNKSIIATSKTPYKNDEFINKDIHDTHFYRTDRQINFPDDFDTIFSKMQIQNIHKQIMDVFKHILNVFKDNIKCFSENKYCYHLYGADLLLTDDLQIKLLEFNGNPACSMEIFQKGKYNYPEMIFENIMNNIVDKRKNTKKVKSTKTKTKTKTKTGKPKFVEL